MTKLSIVSRSHWGAKYGRGGTNVTPSRGGVALHYNGGPISRSSHSKCAARVRSIENFHAIGNGWAGIAYNFLICHHGVVFEGRGWGRRSAAQGTNHGNQNYLAIMFLMGGSQNMTPEMRTAGRLLVLYLRNRGAGNQVRPHSNFTSTSCPGSSVRSWISSGLKSGGETLPSDNGSPYESYNSSAKPGDRLLSLYSAGDDVKRVQEWAGTEPDGWYGPKTVAAVQDAQSRHGLLVDGITGPETWAAALGMKNPVPEKPTVKWPGVYLSYPPVMTHTSIRVWQDRMKERGWRITVDGFYGPKSRDICRAFQREKFSSSKDHDGIVGPKTWNAAWNAPIT